MSAIHSVSELFGRKLQKSQTKKQDFQTNRQQVVVVVVVVVVIVIVIIIIIDVVVVVIIAIAISIADAVHNPKNISSRIVFFFMLILTVFIITSYSATIVSLLQTSSDTINTLQDLMKSPLRLSMVDSFVNVSSC